MSESTEQQVNRILIEAGWPIDEDGNIKVSVTVDDQPDEDGNLRVYATTVPVDHPKA